MKVTLKSISKALGVNESTVSRAINDKPGVSPELKEKINELIKKYNYKKKKIKRNNLLCLVDSEYFSSFNRFLNIVISSIENETKKNNLFFYFSTLDNSISSIKLTKMNFDAVKGIIIIGISDEKIISELENLNIPLVSVDYYLSGKDIDLILIDNIEGIMTAVKYLAQMGHKKIAYLTGNIKKDIGAYDRLSGYKKALHYYNLERDNDFIIDCDFTMSGAHDSLLNFLKKSDKRPTAVIGVNDIAAIGAMNAIKEFGLNIPGDISVVGFDDIDLANETTPKLTTLKVKKKLLGKIAVQRLLDIVNNGKSYTYKVLINPELVIRESTRQITNEIK